MEKIKCEYTKLVKLAELVKHPKNPNEHPPEQIKRLAEIIDYQGMRSPIVVSKRSGFITKGHGRLMALISLGWEVAPVDYQDYENEAQEYADIVADNAIAEWASLDLAKINHDFTELGPETPAEMLGLKSFLVEPMDKDWSPEDEWDGMPEFDQPDATSYRHIIVHFDTDSDALDFFQKIGQRGTNKTKSIWHPQKERMDTESKRYE